MSVKERKRNAPDSHLLRQDLCLFRLVRSMKEPESCGKVSNISLQNVEK